MQLQINEQTKAKPIVIKRTLCILNGSGAGAPIFLYLTMLFIP